MLCLKIKGSLLAPKSTIKLAFILGKRVVKATETPKAMYDGVFEQIFPEKKQNKTQNQNHPSNTNPTHTSGFRVCLLTPHNHILDTLIK